MLSAEIAAISAAPKYIQENPKPLMSELVVFSGSQQALRAGNGASTGRTLLGRIAESIDALSKAGIDVRFRWSPGHKGVVGNEEAKEVAREASSQEGRPIALARERVRVVGGVT
jgi:ribonuclease HI